jgi:hypothetical protein
MTLHILLKARVRGSTGTWWQEYHEQRLVQDLYAAAAERSCVKCTKQKQIQQRAAA